LRYRRFWVIPATIIKKDIPTLRELGLLPNSARRAHRI
jgi:hypothetical protein